MYHVNNIAIFSNIGDGKPISCVAVTYNPHTGSFGHYNAYDNASTASMFTKSFLASDYSLTDITTLYRGARGHRAPYINERGQRCVT